LPIDEELGGRRLLIQRKCYIKPSKWPHRSENLSFVDSFKSERLRGAFRVLFGEAMGSFPTGALFLMIGFMAKKSSGDPIGGSLAFARAIEAKYLALGGNIRYGSKVDHIIVETASGAAGAVGLAGAWGESRGDYIVSAEVSGRIEGLELTPVYR
jgi:phytoene dehydrogenase-like protein